MRLQSGVGICGATDIKPVTPLAAQNMHAVTHPEVFRVMLPFHGSKRDHVFAAGESRGKYRSRPLKKYTAPEANAISAERMPQKPQPQEGEYPPEAPG
jgi:hypothetical protein